ncbi:MAG: hypothetical protein J6U14_10035 [Bacteroidaceae bacterium]|nr:hypothetical protein [Bacteroidaceae bacterium]
MRKYEGLISEEREMHLNSIEWMAYEEHNAYIQSHPEILSEKVTQIEETEMSPKEMCDKYGLVDMTNFFISHGVKLQD